MSQTNASGSGARTPIAGGGAGTPHRGTPYEGGGKVLYFRSSGGVPMIGKLPKQMPTVAVPTVAKVVSATIFMFCLLLLLIWLISGFWVLYPPLCVLIQLIAAVLWAVSSWTERLWNK